MASAQPPPPPPTDPNPVSLKVMRLSKPSLHQQLPSPPDFLSPYPPPDARLDDGSVPVSGALVLEHTFGEIYLGETFSCYISLANTSPVELTAVGLKVEVQTQLQRETLSDSSAEEAVPSLAPQRTVDKIVAYELKDVGIHILICSALYTDRTGERKYFRKFFKFQVNNPLSMKSKTHALTAHNEVIVETQLQNAMPKQLFLRAVDFKPTPQFEATSLNAFPPAPKADAATVVHALAPTGEGGSPAEAVAAEAPTAQVAPAQNAYMKPGDTQQYMFRLRGRVPPEQLRQIATLGRMEVQWNTAGGESGRLQSNTVQRKLPAARGVEVHLVAAPSEVDIETPFEVRCSVCNTSSSEMQLQLTATMMLPPATAAIVVDGVCTRNLGTFRPNSSQEISLRLIAIEPGVQQVTGLQLIDALSEQAHEIGPLADVCCEPQTG